MMGEEVEGRQRPVPLHREKHPDLDVEGCFGCRAAGIRFGGLERLKQAREQGVTQAEMRREIIADARRDGVDIKQAGVTSPTSGPLM